MPDILTPTTSATAARYSYYVVDIVTNTVLAQIPFEDVSYGRSLGQPGSFTGKITTTEQTNDLDLYSSTMPGKSALYVMRNDVCVWGGIIWSRGYDMVGRSLTVSASEFTSYFNRRHIWKTYTYTFTAELLKINKTDKVKVTLTNKTLRVPFATTDGSGNKTKIYVSFSDANLVKYSAFYNIVQDTDDQEPTQTTFYLDIPKLPASASAYGSVTVSARVDTYEYIRELLKDVSIDFSDVEFANEVIAPGIKENLTITYRSCTDNEVTVTTEEKHGFVKGQVVDIKNLPKALNGKYEVTAVSTPYEFKYSIPVYPITHVKRQSGVATVYVNTSGGTNPVKIPVGAEILVGAVTDTSFNANVIVTATTNNSFSYTNAGATKAKTADTGSITIPNISVNVSVLNPTNFRVFTRKIQTTSPKGVTHVIRESGKVTMWTKTDHGFKRADKVKISIKVKSSDTNDVYASLNNSDIPVVITSATARSFSYYQADYSDTKNDIKKNGNRIELATTKKNSAQLATPVKKLILTTSDTHTYEVGDYLYVGGVDGYDWTTPLYNGYKTIEEIDTDSSKIRNRERSASGKTTIYTEKNHGYDVGDYVTISGMTGGDSSINGTYKITSVSDPANAADGVAYFKFWGLSGSAITKAGSLSDRGTAVSYGDTWVAFGMPEYGTVKEPNDIIPLSKRSYDTVGRVVTMYTSQRHGLSVGDKIRINIDADKNEIYEGVFVVQTVSRDDAFTYKLSEDKDGLPTKSYKYQDVGGSLTRIESKVGFYPRLTASIGRVGRRNNAAVVKATNHDFAVGDYITVSMSGSTYDSFENSEDTIKVTEVIDDDHFAYASTGTDVGKVTINRKERSGSTVTLRSTAAHGYTTGEKVYVLGVDSRLNGEFTITGTPASTTFTYTTATSGTIAQTAISSANAIAYSTIDASGTAYIDYEPHGASEAITHKARAGTTATLTVPDHSLKVGDYAVVFVYGAVNSEYNNNNKPVKITAITANTISYITDTSDTVSTTAATGRVSYSAQVEKRPIVIGRSYGEFPNNSDLGGLDFSTSDYSNESYQNSIIRGSDLTTVAQLLETYSNTIQGFDYRIDCSVDYDVYGNKIFKRTFVLVPRTPESLSDYLSKLPDGKLPTGIYAPPSAFGADKYVFEYPGNVSNFNMSENSSDAATRMFVVGGNDDFGGDGSARFSAATATDLLNAGWPLLDKSEKQEWPLIGINVVNVDNWGNYDAELDFHKTAERFLNESKPPMGDFIVTVNGSLNPIVGTYSPGDWCSLRINDAFFNSRLASILEPRKDVVVRKIDTIQVTVPNNPAFPEQIDLTLVPEWQVDTIGK
jgi:hypothetical protein